MFVNAKIVRSYLALFLCVIIYTNVNCLDNLSFKNEKLAVENSEEVLPDSKSFEENMSDKDLRILNLIEQLGSKQDSNCKNFFVSINVLIINNI